MKRLYLLFAVVMMLGLNASAAAKLQVTGSGISPTKSQIFATADNRINTLVQSITVLNNGDVTLNPGDEGYELVLYSYSANVDLQTYPIPDVLAPGESKTYEIHWDFDFTPLDAAYVEKAKYNGKQCVWDTFRIKEKISSTTQYIGPWMDVYKYGVGFDLVGESSLISVSGVIDFGYNNTAKTLTYRVRATGAADATVTSITVPEGYTVTPATPFVIDGMLKSEDNFATIEITLDPTLKTGVASGDMVISVADGGEKSYPLQGVAMSADDFFEDFESGENPVGWIIGKNWVSHELPTSMKSENNLYAFEHSRSGEEEASMLITPRLVFTEGSGMLFNAAKMSAYSSTKCRLRVYWSPDRSNWQLLKEIDNQSSQDVEHFPSSNSSWGSFLCDNIPAGEGYIGFEGNYVQINDVYGGKLASPDYDLYISDFDVPKRGLVNDPVNTVLKLTNMMGDKEVKANEYTVQLFANGKLVDTVETVDMAGGATDVAFNMGYTPHESGSITMKAVVKVGKYTYEISKPVNVAAEAAATEIVIGEQVDDSNNRSALIPLSLNFKNSMSQNIYPAEFLAQFGLKKGDRITSVSYDGYDSNSSKIITGDVAIYMSESEQTGISTSSPLELDEATLKAKLEGITFLYDGKGEYQWHEFFSFAFGEESPYVYDGGNLFVVLKSENQSGYSNAYFRIDPTLTGKSIYKRNDNHASFLTANWNVPREDGLPVMRLSIAKDPARAIGTVTDANGNPVADVLVSYTAGNVLYTGMTDENGKYDITIYRPEHEYTVTADNEYYPIATAAETVKYENGALIAQKDIQLGEFGTEREFDVTIHVSNAAGQSMEGLPFTLRSNRFSLTYSAPETILDAEGKATIKCFGGSHTATFSAPGMKELTVTFGVNKNQDRYFELAEDVKAPYGVNAELQHDVFTGVNNIMLTWNNEVAAFTDDFESYKPFAIEFEPWTGIDGDMAAPAVLTGSYDHAGELNYGQIINPYAVEPMWDLNNYWTLAARSGRQYLGFIVRSDGNPLDDYAITPAVEIGDEYVLRFYAKGSDKVNARFTVGVTEVLDNPSPSDFTTISEGNYIEASYADWTKVQIPLADYAGKEVKLAIHCISQNGSFISMIDDIFIGRLSPATGAAKPHRSAGNPNESFIITLNGEEVGTTTDYNYLIPEVAYGEHELGVQAKYVNTQSEVVTMPFSINADDFVKATVTLKTNNGVSGEDMVVAVEGLNSGDVTAVYSVGADSEGVANFPYLPKGVYRVKVDAKDFNEWQQVADVNADTDVVAYLFETLVTPFNLTVDSEEQADGTFNALAKWNQDLGFADGFETYADFATGSFGGWKTVDLNDATAFSYPISLNGNIITFPGCSTPQAPACVAPMVFNPKATTPSMEEDGHVKAPEGDKLVIFQGPQAASADKWLISPAIEVRSDYEWSVLAKSYPTYPETIEFCVSEEGSDNPEDFTVIDVVSPSFEQWTQYSINVGEYAGKNVRFAIHCTSRDGFIALVDDFRVGRKGGENVASVGKVKDYMVMLDNKTLGSTPEASYALANLNAGRHTFGVVARYESGMSEMSTIQFNLASGIDGVNSDNNINVRGINGAILVDAPAGMTVDAYSAAGVAVASNVSDGTQMRIEATAGVYAVKVGNTTVKVIVR